MLNSLGLKNSQIYYESKLVLYRMELDLPALHVLYFHLPIQLLHL